MTQKYTDEVRERSDGLLADCPDSRWDGEPDYIQWVDEASNLDCLIVRNASGALCGYVGVPPQHPMYKTEFESITDQIYVHGGLSYSDLCQVGGKVCHIPFDGREHDIWWFGFDCAHFNDLMPLLLKYLPEPYPFSDDTSYRDVEYVKSEVTALANQLKLMEIPNGRV